MNSIFYLQIHIAGFIRYLYRQMEITIYNGFHDLPSKNIADLITKPSNTNIVFDQIPSNALQWCDHGPSHALKWQKMKNHRLPSNTN